MTGLGKTFVGSEKMKQLNNRINLVVCQKSKVSDWFEHFDNNYKNQGYIFLNLTKKLEFEFFIDMTQRNDSKLVGIINYDLVWRKPELLKLKNFTLMLDESSLIQNRKAKRTKSILKMKAENVILLSGTPCSGKYENLWTQAHLLGWDITEKLYNKQYVNWDTLNIGGMKIKTVNKETPYKNIERLKRKLRGYGAVFMKTEECYQLPTQNVIDVTMSVPRAYQTFNRHSIVEINGTELVGDTNLTKRLYLRMLASQYNNNKIVAFSDLIASSQDRFVVFYNFKDELEKMREVAEKLEKPISLVNGQVKDLENYENESNSITFVQYQAGAKGLNLQKANKIIYFSPTEKCEDYQQSMKRIHRIGQEKPCYYYRLIAKNSIDELIYSALERGVDFTDALFERGCK